MTVAELKKYVEGMFDEIRDEIGIIEGKIYSLNDRLVDEEKYSAYLADDLRADINILIDHINDLEEEDEDIKEDTGFIKTYAVGQRFASLGDGEYILAQVSTGKVCLIGLSSGNRWREPIQVKSTREISAKEWKEISDGKFIERR